MRDEPLSHHYTSPVLLQNWILPPVLLEASPISSMLWKLRSRAAEEQRIFKTAVLADPSSHEGLAIFLIRIYRWKLQKAEATRLAMEELGRRVAATKPETLVVVTPHGHRIDQCFSILHNARVQGTLDPEPDRGGGVALSRLRLIEPRITPSWSKLKH
jgi:hypothetical protein